MIDLDECKNEMESTLVAFSNELKNIRTGRVSPDILKVVTIESYGSKMPLTQLSNINNLDNMTLSVSVWDTSLVKIVEKNILESNLGVTPQSDGNNIILKFPELTAERRKELVKIISDSSEKYKISVRNIRRKFIELVKSSEKEKLISIDDSKKHQNDIQKITDDYISKIELLVSNKEQEILKV